MSIKSSVIAGLVVLIVLFISVGQDKASFTEGIHPGDLAPGITSVENNCEIDFHNHSGRYTLVNFWAAYDATSRVRNIRLWNKMKELDSSRIALYSISMDEKASVYRETLKTDRLETTNQLYAGQGRMSPLYKKYGLKTGFKNFLIDDKGVIVAINVTPERLSGIVNKGVAKRPDGELLRAFRRAPNRIFTGESQNIY